MSEIPKLSFIVLSYNYAQLIGQTIKSIQNQTFQDFEIVIIDDHSTDNSLDVIRNFDDNRIRLQVNDENIGGAASYNRAVSVARGQYLVNLDADDWIAPRKCEVQLRFMKDTGAAIVGTYAQFVDEAGNRHPKSEWLESYINAEYDLNAVDAWIGHNRLIRSSTMVDRAAHLVVGLDDVSMVRAPDYELWTRFHSAGYRFGVVPEKLTYYRAHSGGVTHKDPQGTFLEMAYAVVRNLVPEIERKALWSSLFSIVDYWTKDPCFTRLRSFERYRLMGFLISARVPPDYAEFRQKILREFDAQDELILAGRRLLALTRHYQPYPTCNRRLLYFLNAIHRAPDLRQKFSLCKVLLSRGYNALRARV